MEQNVHEVVARLELSETEERSQTHFGEVGTIRKSEPGGVHIHAGRFLFVEDGCFDFSCVRIMDSWLRVGNS